MTDRGIRPSDLLQVELTYLDRDDREGATWWNPVSMMPAGAFLRSLKLSVNHQPIVRVPFSQHDGATLHTVCREDGRVDVLEYGPEVQLSPSAQGVPADTGRRPRALPAAYGPDPYAPGIVEPAHRILAATEDAVGFPPSTVLRAAAAEVKHPETATLLRLWAEYLAVTAGR